MMQNSELENIAGSMNEAIHRAYALGRGDALRRVVEMVQADELGGKAVALLGPADSTPSAPADTHRSDTHHSEPHAIEVAAPAETSGPTHADTAAHEQAGAEPAPWWRR